MAECQTVRYLREVAARQSTDASLARAAQAALDIVADIDVNAISVVDIDCLHALVDAIYQDGKLSLLAHLCGATADCPICAALSRRMAMHEEQAQAAA